MFTNFGGDFFIFVSLFTVNFILFFFITNNYSIIHILILIEIIILSVGILLPVSASIITNFPEGEVFALFAIAIAAAESALALSFYIFLKYKKPIKKILTFF